MIIKSCFLLQDFFKTSLWTKKYINSKGILKICIFLWFVAYDRAEVLKSHKGTEFERKIHFYRADLTDGAGAFYPYFQHVDMISFFFETATFFWNMLNWRITNCLITPKENFGKEIFHDAIIKQFRPWTHYAQLHG